MRGLWQGPVVRICVAFLVATGLSRLLAVERETPEAPDAAAADQAEGRRPGDRKPAEPPAVVGTIAAYEASKSMTVAVRVRGGKTRENEFQILDGRTRIELPK